MKKIQTVIVDEGSTQIKVCWKDKETGELRQFVMPSNVAMKTGTDVNGDWYDSAYVVDEDDYYTFDNKHREKRMDTNLDRYQVSTANLVLLHDALRKSGFGDQKIDILVTLPVDQFFLPNGTRDNNRIQRKKDKLMSKISNRNNLPLAQINSIGVMSESIPALFDIQLNDDLELDEEIADMSAILVLDIGGTTTDMSLTNGDGAIARRDTLKVGVYDIETNIREKMIGPDIRSIDESQMQNLIRTQEFRGKNVSAEIRKAVRPVQSDIVSAMVKFEADPASLDAVLIVGGGAALFGQSLAEEYADGAKCNVIIPKNPDISVARGMLKSAINNELCELEETDA